MKFKESSDEKIIFGASLKENLFGDLSGFVVFIFCTSLFKRTKRQVQTVL